MSHAAPHGQPEASSGDPTASWFQAMVEGFVDPLLLLDRDHSIRYANQAFLRLFDYQPAQVLGQPYTLLTSQPDLDGLTAQLAKLQSGSGPVREEHLMVCHDGTPVIATVTLNPLPDPQDTGMIVLHLHLRTAQIDTTERHALEAVLLNELKQAEKAVTRMANLLKTSERVAHVGGWEVDLEADTHFWSDETYRIHEVDPTTFQPKMDSALQFYTPASRSVIEAAVEQLIATQQSFNHELEIITAQGRHKWVQAVGEAVVDHGRTVKIRGSFRDIQTEKEVKEALHQSEARFRAIFAKAPISIIIHEKETGAIVDANKAAYKSYGFDAVEALRSNAFWIEPPYSGAEALAWIHKAATQGTQHFEWMSRTVTGEVFWEEVYLRAVTINGLERVLATSIDITKRKQAEADIKHNEQILRLFVEHSPAAIAMFDMDMCYIVASYRYRSDYRLGTQNLVGRSHYEVFPEMTAEHRAIHQRCLVGTVVTNEEDLLVRGDGTQDWVRYELHPWYGVTGKIGGMIFFSEVITERKMAEESIRIALTKYQTLFESFPLGITVTDKAGHILETNPIAEKLLGIAAEEHKQRRIDGTEWRIIRPDGTAMPTDEYASVRALKEGQKVENIEMGIRKPNGELVWINATAAPIPLADYGVVVTYSDITERKHINDELRRSNVELAQFAYVASHDLQEPLRTVAGMVQLLQQRYQNQLDERANEYIYFAVDASNRMQQLINDLLDFSRVDRKGRPFAATKMEYVLQVALANLQHALTESGAQISSTPMPVVKGDEGQLVQVLQNLIGNAIKFSGNKTPKIHVSAQKVAEGWQFAVQDNGIGIDPQYFERVFLIFQRLHTRRAYPGTGIGLALCKKIIERHEGHIWIESILNEGSTFFFTIPERL